MDCGEVQFEKLGWIAWFLGKKAVRRIVREADIEAAMQDLAAGVKIVKLDPKASFLIYESPDGEERIRFRAGSAWLPNEPTVIPNSTRITIASVTSEGKVLVLEGLHRTRSMAREMIMIEPHLGGVLCAPGWLDFVYDPDGAILSESSLELFGPWNPVPAK